MKRAAVAILALALLALAAIVLALSIDVTPFAAGGRVAALGAPAANPGLAALPLSAERTSVQVVERTTHGRDPIDVQPVSIARRSPEPDVGQRDGSVRGVVRGGAPDAFARSVVIWRVEDDGHIRAPRPLGHFSLRQQWSCRVDACGSFARDGLSPGAYFAAVYRHSGSHDERSNEWRAHPVIDDGIDPRGIVQLAVVAGGCTDVDLVDLPLGTLRGRVLLAGQPFGGARVIATRRGWRTPSFEPQDTTNLGLESDFEWAPGQCSAADGTFTFFYRDGGDVEIRVRHPNGHATSAPVIVSLPVPTPYADAECAVVLPAAAISGRFPVETLPEEERSRATAVLFPMQDAATNPHAGWEGSSLPLSLGCARIEASGDGRFRFEFLPAGDFVVRVFASKFHGRALWQRVIRVGDVPIDLGELTLPKLVDAHFTWRFDDRADSGIDDGFLLGVPMRSVEALRGHGDDAAAVWVASFLRHAGEATLAVEPGRYTLRPSDWHRSPRTDRVVDVASDGTVTPSVATFPPCPPQPLQGWLR